VCGPPRRRSRSTGAAFGSAFDVAYPHALRAAAALVVVGLPLVTLLQGRPVPITHQEVQR